MMGPRQVEQGALFYEFSLDTHVPADHLLRSIDRFVDLTGLRQELAPFYAWTGCPSVDPELIIRMLIVGYCLGIRFERRLCDEVHLNLAYRWFCRLGLDGRVPDHSTFSKEPPWPLRDSDLLRRLFETVLAAASPRGSSVGRLRRRWQPDQGRCQSAEGGGRLCRPAARGREPRCSGVPRRPRRGRLRGRDAGAAQIHLARRSGRALDGAHGGQAFFAYTANYLIDLDHAIIVDVEATTAIRQAEVAAAKRMIERSRERFDLYPAKLADDSGYGSAEMLGWLVYEQGIEPHISVFDKSTRTDGTFSRADFTYDQSDDVYRCPAGQVLTTTGTLVNDGRRCCTGRASSPARHAR